MGGSEEAKLFVGGLSQETTKESLKNHFSEHGCITDAVVMYDSQSGRSRGFGFVTFDKADVIDAVLATAQTVDGKEVDCKRACPREVMAARQFGGPHYHPQADYLKTNKIFVGGLPDMTPDELKAYFAKYGKVLDAVLMTDKNSNRPRGFGFITYESTDVVDEVVRKYHDHQIKDKWVEVKKAQSKEQLVQTRGVGSGAGRGGNGYGGYVPGGYGAGAYGGCYDGYRGAFAGYENRRPYGGGVGYDPYAGHPGYAATGYSDGGARRPYNPYGPNRSTAGGYRNSGDPYSGMNAGYGVAMGGGYVHPGSGGSAYANSAYGGGGLWTPGS